ncbi:MAG: hypothetical protein RMK64_09930 [Rhodovarius sp.]|nr:hypothetical protein [Rhodovarius sp.]MCX7930980.1 hypothetical protein [Rhodovarius sp.]MDW8315276.1 hypothetical protein [Rhodovarius sp.]
METAFDADAPPDLSYAGSVVDKAIEFMIQQNISPISAASALLGGAIGLMAQNMSDAQVAHVLRQALQTVESGQLHVLPPLPRQP